MKILILNHYSGNKGDRAVLYYLVRSLQRKGQHDITVSVSDTRLYDEIRDKELDKVHFVPWGRDQQFDKSHPIEYFFTKLRSKLSRDYYFPLISFFIAHGIFLRFPFTCPKAFDKALKESDIVISTGGHLLTTRFYPEGNCAMIYDLFLALIAKKKIVLWSQTYGPFDYESKTKEKAMQVLLSKCNKVFVRDLASTYQLEKMGFYNYIRSAESVIGLSDVVSPYILPTKRENLVGITVYNAEKRSLSEEEKYIQQMVSITEYLVSLGFVVKFFSHEMNGAIIDDRPLIREIKSKVNKIVNDNVIIEDSDRCTYEHLHEVSKCKMFIGHKTHSVVFGLATGTPILAVSYHPKTLDFMKIYGLSENCLAEGELDYIFPKIDHILKNLDSIGKKQHDISLVYSKLLSQHLDMVLK